MGCYGSAVDGSFDTDSSDVDVLVEFDAGPGFDYVESYFGLREGLERLFGRAVDLVSVTSVPNPYFPRPCDADPGTAICSLIRGIRDPLSAADLIRGFVEGRTFPDYQSDAMLRSAVERQFEGIAKPATNCLGPTRGLRDRSRSCRASSRSATS